MNYNLVFIAGKVASDPKVVNGESGGSYTSFSVDVSEPATFRKSPIMAPGTQEYKHDHLKVVVRGRQAISCATYLERGQSVVVRGKLRSHTWEQRVGENAMLGTMITTMEIVADQVEFGARRTRKQKAEEPDPYPIDMEMPPF